MRNLTARTGRASILLGIIFTISPLRAPAQEAVSSGPLTFGEVSSTEKSSTTVHSDELGTGIFSPLPFKLTISVRGGYDDNVTTSNTFRRSSPFTNGSVAATYDFGDARTQLNLAAGAGVTYYWDNVQVPGLNLNDYDINTYIRFDITHKATPRLTLNMDAYLTYQSEPDFSVAQGTNRRSGNYFYTQDRFTANYLWAPRFATATSYTFTAIRYDESAVAFFEDRVENIFGNEFRFLLSPTTALVAEYRFELVTYENIGRDSTSHFALGGFDHAFDPQWKVSVRAGAEFRKYDEGESRTSPYFESTLTYEAGKRTTLSWFTRYAIEEPDILVSQGRDTFRTGLSARHDFTSKISASLAAYYDHSDYKSLNQPGVFSPAFTEEDFDLALSLRYAFTRYFGVEAGYSYTNVWGDVSAREYSRNRYWGGLNVTF